MSDDLFEQATTLLSENEIIANRREKLALLRENGNAYPNNFQRDSLAADLLQKYRDHSAVELESLGSAGKNCRADDVTPCDGKSQFRPYSRYVRSFATLCA